MVMPECLFATGVPAPAEGGCRGQKAAGDELQQSCHHQHLQHPGLHRGGEGLGGKAGRLLPLQQGTAAKTMRRNLGVTSCGILPPPRGSATP